MRLMSWLHHPGCTSASHLGQAPVWQGVVALVLCFPLSTILFCSGSTVLGY